MAGLLLCPGNVPGHLKGPVEPGEKPGSAFHLAGFSPTPLKPREKRVLPHPLFLFAQSKTPNFSCSCSGLVLLITCMGFH